MIYYELEDEEMKISTKGRYAIRLMTDLAMNSHGESISLKEVSARQSISVKYLEQIVRQLCNAQLLRSTRGAQGGYKLARPAQEYTVGDVLRAIEGNLAPVACLEDEPNQCPSYEQCITVKMWEGLYKTMTDYLDSITIQDLVDQYMQGNGNYII